MKELMRIFSEKGEEETGCMSRGEERDNKNNSEEGK